MAVQATLHLATNVLIGLCISHSQGKFLAQVLFLGFATTLFWLDELLSRTGWLPRSGLAPAFCVVCLAVAIWALIKVSIHLPQLANKLPHWQKSHWLFQRGGYS